MLAVNIILPLSRKIFGRKSTIIVVTQAGM